MSSQRGIQDRVRGESEPPGRRGRLVVAVVAILGPGEPKPGRARA
jgi:hypothetical protein